jgi:hypothetical protein
VLPFTASQSMTGWVPTSGICSTETQLTHRRGHFPLPLPLGPGRGSSSSRADPFLQVCLLQSPPLPNPIPLALRASDSSCHLLHPCLSVPPLASGLLSGHQPTSPSITRAAFFGKNFPGGIFHLNKVLKGLKLSFSKARKNAHT